MYSNVPRSPSESCYALRASRALERAFLPVSSEALARYIFSPTPRIPSKAFASSLVLHITHKLTHSGLSDPRRAFLLPSAVFAPRTESATVHLVLTPLKYISGALVGIVSAEGASPNGEVMPFVEALNNGIKRGRFVFDTKRKQMVSILDDMGPDALGVVTTNWLDATHHERVFFAIPKQEYSFDRMPRKAMVVLTNLEYQISKMHGERSERTTETPDKLFDMAEAFPAGLNNGVQKVGAFDLSSLTSAIEDIARTMSGVYYGPNLKRDVINTMTGELSSRASGKMVCRLKIPDYVGQCKIRRMVAQDYFLKLLPPGSERWFMQNEFSANLSLLSDEGSNGKSKQVWDEEEREITLDPIALAELDAFEAIIPEGDELQYVVPKHMSKSTSTSSTSTGAPPLLGDMIPPYEGPSVQTSTPITPHVAMQANGTELNEEDLKKRKGEERRIRNRLSAARSNEKRKKREREQKMELETLRERIPMLEDIRQRLSDENKVLRELAEGVL